jgi:hypothetical protein
MGEAIRAVGKLIISIIAASIIATSFYNSFDFFKLGQYLNFPYSAEVCSGSLGLIALLAVYGLMMRLKHQL